jgi:steroid delta-isomerase-like uncharacterized protein
VSTEQNKEIVRAFLDELFNKQRLELIDEFLASDYALYHPGATAPLDRAAFPVFVAGFPAGFSDFRIELESIIAEGDEVATRFILSGTHRGEFMGVQPTGKKVELAGEAFYRLRDGKIVEDRPLIDWAQMLEQLEVL